MAEDITPHEVVSTSPVNRVPAVLSAEDQAKLEIQKFKVSDAAIAELKEKYGSLTIPSVEDRESLKIVTDAWRHVRNLRISVEKKHKELKADYLLISRTIDGEKNRLVKELEPLEDHLKNEIDKVE